MVSLFGTNADMKINVVARIDKIHEILRYLLVLGRLTINSRDIIEHIHTKMDRLTCITSALSKMYCANGISEDTIGSRKKTTIIDNNPAKPSAHTAKNIHFLHSKILFSILSKVIVLWT